ncbi:MAG: TIGR01777 family protein [Chloroflexi bacterium]|nr:TIGR01777 family protein [Chloroflexota bacterium]
MRAIITGGTGLIGRRLARELLAAGHEVVILSRNPEQQARHIPPGARAVRWDARTPDGWADLIDADTAIINLAGQNPANWRWTTTHKRRVLESRLLAGEAVAAAIRAAAVKPRALLQASAVGYYGDRGDEILTEASPPNRALDFRADVTQVWERVTGNVGVRQPILRIGIVISLESGALPAFRAAGWLFGAQLGSGRQYIPWIHNDDVAGAIHALLLDEAADGPYNLCVPEPATNREFMAAVGRVLRRPALIPVPAFALRIALGEQAATVLDSQRVIPERLIAQGYLFRFPDLDAALRDLLR